MPPSWRSQYLRYQEFFLNVIAVYRRRQDLKMFLEILLSLGTIAFFSTFALKPTVITIAQLLKDVKAKEETVSKMDQKIQNLSTAHGIFDQEALRIPMVEFSVPTLPAPDSLVRQLEGLANSHTVNILGISIGEVTLLGPAKPIQEKDLSALPEGARGVPISVSATGDFASLLSFLSDLENLRRPIKIDSAAISSSEKESGKILVLVVSGRTPYLGQK